MKKAIGSGFALESTSNDEWYTPPYAVLPLLKYLPKRSKIWCPFDTSASYYVKLLKYKHKCKVIYTHISKGEDFFDLNIDCDYIVSNPPYSKRDKVLERLFSLGKPFAMLVNSNGLFGSVFRWDMMRKNTFEFMCFDRRIGFFRNGDKKSVSPPRPPFHSCYLTSQVLPKPFVFERLDCNFAHYNTSFFRLLQREKPKRRKLKRRKR